MKKRKIISILSYILLAIGALLGGYALLNIYLLQKNLPAGACPVTNNRPLMYVSIGFLAASFILSFFEGKKKSVDENVAAGETVEATEGEDNK